MLRYSLVLLAGLWAAGPAGAASWADSLFDELVKDFGSVPRGPTLTHHFRVVNKTRKPVSISNVRVSCGCVSASALKTFLKPGEETSILARMDSTRFTGAKTVTIFVTFDRPNFQEVRLWVQANGRNDFALSPATLAMGQVKRGNTVRLKTTITFYGHSDARITSARAESNYVKPSFREISRVDSQVVYQLTARLRKDTPVGRWYTDIWVKTNVPGMTQIRVPLTVEVTSALSVSPEAVTMGKVKVNAETERRVIVRGSKPFKITKVSGTDANLLVRDSSPLARTIHVLTVKYKATKTGDFKRNLRVQTDLGGDDGAISFRVVASVSP